MIWKRTWVIFTLIWYHPIFNLMPVCQLCLDDRVIISKLPVENIDHVQQVQPSLDDAGVTLKLNKHKPFPNCIVYLCRILKPGQLEISSPTICGTCGLQKSSIIPELCSFLGLCDVFRLCVSNFARIAGPVQRKPQKGMLCVYTDISSKEQNAAYATGDP